MNVASKELCRDLYAHSLWTKDVYWWHTSFFNLSSTVPGERLYQVVSDDELDDYSQREYLKEFRADPAYDLGYLLRMLPYNYRWLDCSFRDKTRSPMWLMLLDVSALSPEDAACKLAIELFKQEILTKETN